MENGKKNNIIIIALIAIVGLLIYQNAKFKEEMDFLNSRISTMESNINQGLNNNSYRISDEVRQLLNESQNIVSDYKFSYNGVNTKTGIVKVLIEFTLKQSDAASKVYLNLSTQSNSNENDFVCLSANGINYTCELELSYNDNYILNMYQKSDDGSQQKLNSNPYYQNIKDDFENRLSIMESGTSTTAGRTDYSFKLSNKTFGEQDFKIKNVVVKAFYMDKEVFRKDVTSFNIVNSEARDRMNVMIAAGEINVAEVPAVEYGGISADNEGNEYVYSIVSVVHSDTGAPVEKNIYPTYNFKVIVTFNNGEVSEI